MAQAVHASIAVSLDGFVTGPDDSVEAPLGEGGERLHEWLYELASWREQHGREGGQRDAASELLEESFARTGAIVMGRRMFDHAEGPWGDEPPFHLPVFVVTHRPRERLEKQGGTTFTFVTEGIGRALELARAAAGDRDVSVAGGAGVIDQFLRAGLLDELELHVVPIFLGGGVRLFDGAGLDDLRLEPTRVVDSPAVTHIRYRVAS
jgi:dihydrofolate reductase